MDPPPLLELPPLDDPLELELVVVELEELLGAVAGGVGM
jgi:hypothetical protein